MARLYPLFSSSKGNSSFIGNEKGGILIDCGVSMKRLCAALEANNIPLSAVLNPNNAITLVVLSIILTLIGGLIPAKKASKKDPVIALRTE